MMVPRPEGVGVGAAQQLGGTAHPATPALLGTAIRSTGSRKGGALARQDAPVRNFLASVGQGFVLGNMYSRSTATVCTGTAAAAAAAAAALPAPPAAAAGGSGYMPASTDCRDSTVRLMAVERR